MTVGEINAMLANRTPQFKVFNIREIEVMREDLARHAAAMQANVKLRKKIERVEQIAAEFRRDGKYDVSDKLREALK